MRLNSASRDFVSRKGPASNPVLVRTAGYDGFPLICMRRGSGWAGEGNVLKDPASLYSPGERSPAWLELKPKLTLDVTVTGRSDQRIASGDWGEAVKQERSILSRYFIPSITDLPTWARSPSLSPADSQEGRRG